MISQVIRFQSMNGGMKEYSFNIKTTSIPFRKKKKNRTRKLGTLFLGYCQSSPISYMFQFL